MLQVSNIAKGVQTTHFGTNHIKPKSPKSLNSASFGSKLSDFATFFGLNHQRVVFNPLVNNRVGLGTLKVSASIATAVKPSTTPEIVLQPIKEISGTVKLPGSKSLSNRILLLAALSEGTTVADNLLSSDDIHYMLGALRAFGLRVEEDSAGKRAIVEGFSGLFPPGK